MRINFDFSDLQAFLAVAEWGSFQLAAKKLNISQSAVTRRIKKLELQLETLLFERTTRSLKLTIQAKSFRSRAQSILEDAAEAMRAINDETQRFEYQKSALITIAAVPTSTHYLLPNAIKQFHAAGYQAKINILDLFSNDVAEAVLDGEADFGISFSGLEEPGLEVVSLFDDPFVLVMCEDEILAQQPSISWKDLVELPLIVPWKGTGNRLLIDNEMARQKITLNWDYQVHHSATAIGLVEQKVGMAVLPESAVKSRLTSTIKSVPIVEPDVTRVIGLIKRRHQQFSPAANYFYDLLLHQFSTTDDD